MYYYCLDFVFAVLIFCHYAALTVQKRKLNFGDRRNLTDTINKYKSDSSSSSTRCVVCCIVVDVADVKHLARNVRIQVNLNPFATNPIKALHVAILV